LIIVPFRSVHSVSNEDINLCRLFNFSMEANETRSHEIKCSTHSIRRSSLNCALRFRALKRYDKEREFCFAGKVFGNSGVVPFQKKLQIMNFHPRLKFGSKFHQTFLSILHRAYNLNSTGPNRPSFAVIHWRFKSNIS